MRGRPCGEVCSERRGTAWVNTKGAEANARAVIDPLVEGGRVRATARLIKGGHATGARRGRVAGRHAERGHDHPGQGGTPRAVEVDEQGALVKKSNIVVPQMTPTRRVIRGIIEPWRPTASG